MQDRPPDEQNCVRADTLALTAKEGIIAGVFLAPETTFLGSEPVRCNGVPFAHRRRQSCVTAKDKMACFTPGWRRILHHIPAPLGNEGRTCTSCPVNDGVSCGCNWPCHKRPDLAVLLLR